MSNKKKISLKVGSKVFYPSHGAGTVKELKEIEFAGEKREYAEFEFVNKKLVISTPISELENLGIREITSKTTLKKLIKDLKKDPTLKPKSKDYSQLIEKVEEMIETGEVEQFIDAIKFCNYEKDTREKEGRLIPVSVSKSIYIVVSNLVAEYSLASDQSYEDAAAEFEKLSGISVKL